MRNAYRVENYKLMIDSLPITTRSATKLEKKLYNINDAAADPQSAAFLLVCAYNQLSFGLGEFGVELLDEVIDLVLGSTSSVQSTRVALSIFDIIPSVEHAP